MFICLSLAAPNTKAKASNRISPVKFTKIININYGHITSWNILICPAAAPTSIPLYRAALLLIVATCVSVYRGVLGDEEGADRWHYYFRDAFNWTFGTLAVVVCLGETAVLSRACKKAINEVRRWK